MAFSSHHDQRPSKTEADFIQRRTREKYRALSTADLQRRLAAAEDRSQRADTNEDYLSDAFIIQEISAVLSERQ